ncbi:hypothetical protein CSAL01_03443 [Colletotrichum salicis]|uniref:Uncharacterized protein n=1 Tax=Colletotrichum salicis TaxID=1209931 RepID=A0A135UL23_9PEZI|nr:hypothetical protein CSAL01_03443 [Colletotrichum salicis]
MVRSQDIDFTFLTLGKNEFFVRKRRDSASHNPVTLRGKPQHFLLSILAPLGAISSLHAANPPHHTSASLIVVGSHLCEGWLLDLLASAGSPILVLGGHLDREVGCIAADARCDFVITSGISSGPPLRSTPGEQQPDSMRARSNASTDLANVIHVDLSTFYPELIEWMKARATSNDAVAAELHLGQKPLFAGG